MYTHFLFLNLSIKKLCFSTFLTYSLFVIILSFSSNSNLCSSNWRLSSFDSLNIISSKIFPAHLKTAVL
jgi:hypothetical protein